MRASHVLCPSHVCLAAAVWHFFAQQRVLTERGCAIAGCCTGWCWGAFNLSAAQPNASLICGAGASHTRHGKKCLVKATAIEQSFARNSQRHRPVQRGPGTVALRFR